MLNVKCPSHKLCITVCLRQPLSLGIAGTYYIHTYVLYTSSSVLVLGQELLVVVAHPVTHALNLVLARQNGGSEMMGAILLPKPIARHNHNPSVLQHLLAVQPFSCLANFFGLLECSLWQGDGGECIQRTINRCAANTFQLI